MTTVLVWSDDAKLLAELAGKAAGLGTVQAFDAARLPDQDSATIALGLAATAKAQNADLVMVGATKKGKDVGPRLAASKRHPAVGRRLRRGGTRRRVGLLLRGRLGRLFHRGR